MSLTSNSASRRVTLQPLIAVYITSHRLSMPLNILPVSSIGIKIVQSSHRLILLKAISTSVDQCDLLTVPLLHFFSNYSQKDT